MRHQVQEGKISLKYINTSENPADLMTKFLPGEAILDDLARIGCWPREGRADSAPDLCVQHIDTPADDEEHFTSHFQIV